MTDEPSPSDPKEIGRLAAFRYRDFRLFWISLFVSNIGTWMQMTATNWLLYQLTNSPVQLGLNGIFRAIPAIGFGLISGTFADRYDRRRLMLWTQALLGLLALGLGVLDHSGNVQALADLCVYLRQLRCRLLRWSCASSAFSFPGAALGPAQRGGAQLFIVERCCASWADAGWRRHQPHGYRRRILRKLSEFLGGRRRLVAHADLGVCPANTP